MSSALPYMQFYVADYLADTVHLSTLEHGAYLLLLMNYWQRGEPLDSDDKRLSRIAQMNIKDWLKVKGIIAEFFVEEGGKWRHKRVEQELGIAEAHVEQRRNAGRASAKRRANGAATDVSTVDQRPLNERAEIPEQNRSEQKAGMTESSAVAEAKASHRILEEKLREAAGWQKHPAPNLFVIGPIEELLAHGAKLEVDVLPVIRARASSIRGQPNWKYFVGPIQDAMADRAKAGAGVNGAQKAIEDRKAEAAQRIREHNAKHG